MPKRTKDVLTELESAANYYRIWMTMVINEMRETLCNNRLVYDDTPKQQCVRASELNELLVGFFAITRLVLDTFLKMIKGKHHGSVVSQDLIYKCNVVYGWIITKVKVLISSHAK